MDDSNLLVLEPGRAERHYWRDLWAYRELFAILAWRDVAVRYKQTVIGVAWAVIRPFLTMVVFTVIFGQIAKLPSAGALMDFLINILMRALLMAWFGFVPGWQIVFLPAFVVLAIVASLGPAL